MAKAKQNVRIPSDGAIDQAIRLREQYEKLKAEGASSEAQRAAYNRMMAHKIKNGLVEEIEDPDEE